ncbi:ADP-ribose pyrophosphatase YjhB (NUDIX family) [Rhizobium sp. ERR 1071]|uniref:NUDIX hydrolase n=1 Tax=Rhizobium sp. ERR 1071 TaxID=2572677 RepID=UPI00119B2DE7|nr:NUDIX hydrolase [Rhizobium sp. ERR1071]TWB09561.1 ADP-ribose pyrophosphatase YjhB (NUDIX family) [Rhizobium sp. ERR1071]
MNIRRPIPAVLAVVIRDGFVLLVRRANPPDAGLWGFPGGKIEFGEPLAQAAVRELFEETCVQADAGPIFTAVDAFDHNLYGSVREHYVLVATLCRWREGEPIAGDDALEAGWYDISSLDNDLLVTSFGVTAVARQARDLAAELYGTED